MRISNAPRLQIFLSSLFVCLITCPLAIFADYDGSFVVSVYQPRMLHDQTSFVTREGAVALMKKQIDIYEEQAKEAAIQKSQILVFPEYCLYANVKDFSRNSVANFLETVPDPKVNTSWIPCDFKNTSNEDGISNQVAFSCMAKTNNLYIVANIGERQDCNRTVDSGCPSDGRFQFNTNVVFAPNGALVSRYRKKHLFYEPHFNEPAVAEHQVFETPFGKFASIVCFDIYFEDTLNELIRRQNVRNIIFPNMWFNIAPLYMSVPYHSSVAWAANINLISSNLILDKTAAPASYVTGGSGFYNGMSGFSYSSNEGLFSVNMTSIKSDAASNFRQVSKRETSGPGDQKVETYLVSDMKFKAIQLVDMKGKIGVCSGNFCCGLEYEFMAQPNSSVTYMLGASDFADGSGQLDVQSCAVCTVNKKKLACEGIPIDRNVPFAQFNYFRMFANNFKTKFIFPQATVINSRSYQVLHPNLYYSDGKINLRQTSPLHSVVLMGRIYPPHASGTSRISSISCAIIMGVLVLFLL